MRSNTFLHLHVLIAAKSTSKARQPFGSNEPGNKQAGLQLGSHNVELLMADIVKAHGRARRGSDRGASELRLALLPPARFLLSMNAFVL